MSTPLKNQGVMTCPRCGTVLNQRENHFEGEDEGELDTLFWYAEWCCPCGRVVKDYDVEYIFPDDLEHIQKQGAPELDKTHPTTTTRQPRSSPR